jgi:outer membrane cobalamin receptor
MCFLKYFVLVVLSLLSATAFAGNTGKIVGRVTDSAGEPLVGVNIFILDSDQGAVTNLDGHYLILNLRPGTYTVRASYIGFQSVLVMDVRIHIDRTTTQDFILKEGVVSGSEVVVTAERPLVERDRTSSRVSISSKDIQLLPTESFGQIVDRQAGVMNGHFRGGRMGEVAYMVDGVPVNDVFDYSTSYQVETMSIEEVEIISGTFNAEYGQAQSGVVNIVTKDGGAKTEGSIQFIGGDYLTTRSGLFQRLDKLSPIDHRDVQGSFSGPVPFTNKALRYHLSARYSGSDGYLYGRHIVEPLGQSADLGTFVTVDGREVYVPALGDSSYVPMNDGRQLTLQGKISARLFKGNRTSIMVLSQQDSGRDYNHLYRYNPFGIPTTFGRTNTVNLTGSQSFTQNMYVSYRFAHMFNQVRSYLYENPLDSRYPRDDAPAFLGGNFSFLRGGAIMDHTERSTGSTSGHLDMTWQANYRHQLKLGVSFRTHDLAYQWFKVKNNATTGFQPEIPLAGTPDHVNYREKPFEVSAFIQDKAEYDYLVMNVGLRFDYFDPNSQILSDYGRPQTSERLSTKPEWQISPRIGLAYPISTEGVFHVAYGHFFQVPAFQFLYTNPDYTYDPESGLGRVFGNPQLKAQQTVSYEFGLRQGFYETMTLSMTAFYKDIRNLLGSRIEVIQPGFDEPFPLSRYGRYVNRDYGQVKGVLLEANRRMTDGFSFTFSYSYQVAMGNASDPRSVLLDEMAGIEPDKQMVPLDWDRRHQLNSTVSLQSRTGWMFSVLADIGGGLPYTPSVADQRIGLENSDRKPVTHNLDLQIGKTIKVAGLDWGVLLRVYNVFDTANERNVYSDTGRAFPNLRYYSGDPIGLNTKQEFLRRPDFYSEPRRVTIGISTSF